MTEFREEDHPNCMKLKEHGDEWRHIAMFHEWLTEKGILLASYEVYGDNFPEPMRGKQRDAPWPYPRPLRDLYYEYVEVDPNELERERRQILEIMRQMNKQE